MKSKLGNGMKVSGIWKVSREADGRSGVSFHITLKLAPLKRKTEMCSFFFLCFYFPVSFSLVSPFLAL